MPMHDQISFSLLLFHQGYVNNFKGFAGFGPHAIVNSTDILNGACSLFVCFGVHEPVKVEYRCSIVLTLLSWL